MSARDELRTSAAKCRRPVIHPVRPGGRTAVARQATANPVARDWRVNGREAN